MYGGANNYFDKPYFLAEFFFFFNMQKQQQHYFIIKKSYTLSISKPTFIRFHFL